MTRLLIALLAAVCPAIAAAQGTVYESQGKQGPVLSNEPTPGATAVEVPPTPGVIYESKDKAGPVFTDQPLPGARQVELPPPNVIQAPPTQPQQASSAGPAAAYRSLAIVSPANQGTIHSNTGAFDVKVQIEPALNTAQGDVIKVKLDGTLLPQSFGAADFQVTDSDWAGAANPNNVEHTLQVAVVSRSGTLWLESTPVSFYAQRAVRREEAQPRR